MWLKVGRGSQCARRNKLEIKISMCSLRGGGGSCARRNKLEIKISMCSLRECWGEVVLDEVRTQLTGERRRK